MELWQWGHRNWAFHYYCRAMGGKALIKVICNMLSKRGLVFFVLPSHGWLVTKTLHTSAGHRCIKQAGGTPHSKCPTLPLDLFILLTMSANTTYLSIRWSEFLVKTSFQSGFLRSPIWSPRKGTLTLKSS